MTTKGSNNKRELRSILFADAVGYTRLMQKDEEATQEGVNDLVNLFAKGCREFDGEILDIRGDGIFSVFASALNSVRFATKIQEIAEKYNDRYEEDRKIRFRIGIHLGDVIKQKKQYFGDNVNIAARIEGLAETGGVCISAAVYQQVRNSGEFGYVNLGPKRLKNVKEPIDVYHVTKDTNTAIRVASQRGPPALAAAATPGGEWLSVRPSVAVLPFKNTNGDPNFEYFSDGITEDIINNLSRFHNLFVISRSSSFTYKRKAVTAQQIGTELGVRYIADGSVRKAGNRVRIAVQLVDTSKDQTIWTEQYDRNLDDIFEIQDEVSAIICNATSAKISAEESQRLKRLLPNDLRAYDNVLRGQQRIFRYTKEDMRQARKLYEAAANLDPRYSRALASIAQTLNFEWLFCWADESEDTLERALSIARQAVSVDDSDARGHAGVGFVSLYKKEHDNAILAYQRALELNPNDADVISDLGDTYAHAGRAAEAVGLIKKAMRLNPFYPDEYLWNLGGAYYTLKKYQQAIDAIKRMNNPTEGSRILAASYAQLGQLKEAQVHAQKTLQAHPDFSLDKWAAMMPDKFAADSEHFVVGLRKAGLK